MSGGGLADEGWHFFHPASSFVSSLRLMKLAFQLPPGPDTQTPKGNLTSHSQSRTESWRRSPPPPSTRETTRARRTLARNWHSRLQHIHYQTRRPVYFCSSQQASIIQTFFLRLCRPSLFFPLCALRSPTNELNTEETWKRLDEAWLSEQRGDDIVARDYTHLYQQ